ncbi:hypothetical protein [Pseudoalteromonas denitrificans]|uniref:Uncharacterized protein n=1 Tax=Pseudoalteromonas denitrificans DSM 6059 TaxID=1123010 RepID=A0A1I1LX43_9GAMM|nr:hypothetical protein [Pseudoalteromonas denitrificans]SFC77807.1 hypothetical protein SAMN02745724_02511 [Pseudoalteromonas denitrificans DSM 6059]
MQLLNPFQLDKNYQILYDRPSLNENEEDETFKVIIGEKLLILQNICPPTFGEDIPGFSVDQIELPYIANQWLINTIEDKFWKSAAQGGLPSGTYSYKEEVNGEKLALYREMNVGAKNQKGFRLTNFSRPSRIYDDDDFQDFFITDLMLLEGGLLDALKQL